MFKKLIFLMIMLAFTSSKAMEINGYDITKSWENALVFVPSNFLTKSVAQVKVDSPSPVVIFLHGCGGINEHEIWWAQHLKSEGFIVVLPDSMKIPNRVVNCISETHTTNIGKVPVHELRPAEAMYAISKVKEQSWADQKNIFLMGHSEGGMGAFLTQTHGLKGVIVSGFPCKIRRKVGSSDDTPFMAINWEIDPYFSKNNIPQSQCSEKPFWKNRADALEIIITGKGHATAYDRSVRASVTKFLKDRSN